MRPMLTVALSLLVLVSAFIHIRAEYRGPRLHVYIFKPLTTFLILLMALVSPGATTSLYRGAIVLGLAFSLVGDVFLMLPSDRFLLGLISFLLAHMAYIGAFSLGLPFQITPGYLIPLLVYAILMFSILQPHLGRMKLPVLLYTFVIVTMAWQAAERWAGLALPGALWALLGALLFVLSDTILAWNRFRRGFRLAQLMILTTYFGAQWLIALSV